MLMNLLALFRRKKPKTHIYPVVRVLWTEQIKTLSPGYHVPNEVVIGHIEATDDKDAVNQLRVAFRKHQFPRDAYIKTQE